MKMVVYVCVLVLIVMNASAQELACNVSITNIEVIPSSQRDYLKNFKNDVERYLNSTRFSTEELDEKIKCSFDISFTSYNGNNQYLASVVIVSQRPIFSGDTKTDKSSVVLRIKDQTWEFTYQPNQRMVQDDYSVDPLTDFLDFYAYIIIGFDCETYLPKSGSKLFQKAFNICQQEGPSDLGKYWQQSSTSYNRYGLADELNNARYDPFHTAINDYYMDGIDKIATDRQSGLDNILKLLESISDLRRRNPTSVILKQFFDARYREIAEIFASYSDRSVYEQLSRFDEEHRSEYQIWKDKSE